MRTNRRSTRRAPQRAALNSAPTTALTPARRDAERVARSEIEAWGAHAVPDPAAPLGTEDLVRLLRDCVAALDLDAAIASGFTVNTVHYYRRKDIIDPPEGRTVAARYVLRHLWQIAGARLAGYLGLVSLAEARSAIRGADSPNLLDFLAARVTDARARHAVRTPRSPNTTLAARPLPGVMTAAAATPVAAGIPSVMIALPGDAWCIIPAGHAAHRSPAAATELARALTTALATPSTL